MTNKVKDIPIEQCILDCSGLIRKGLVIHQKWTCSHCGSRQAMDTPNTIHYLGKCDKCNKVTSIKECGYLVKGPTEVVLGALFGETE